jgi:transposase
MYSIDFRRKVLDIRKAEGLTLSQTAQRFHIAVNTIFLWTKCLAPKLKRCKPATRLDMEALTQDVVDYPNAFYRERAKRLGVSRSAVGEGLKRLKITYIANPL